MLIFITSFFIINLSILGLVKNKNNFLFFILYLEIILITITYLITLLCLVKFSYFGQIYGLFILTIAAIESAIIISLIVQFYKYRGTIHVNVINFKLKK